jgi:hypothetical protein
MSILAPKEGSGVLREITARPLAAQKQNASFLENTLTEFIKFQSSTETVNPNKILKAKSS